MGYRIGVPPNRNADPVPTRPDTPLRAVFNMGPGPTLLLDHLVGAQQNRWGYSKNERVGGLAVHDHLELGRELHREIARLLAAQNAIDIGGGADVYRVDSVGEQTAVSGEERWRVDRRY